MNIRGLIDRTARTFAQEGLPTPRLDAEVLLAACLQTDRSEFYIHPEREVPPDRRRRFDRWVGRRRRGQPLLVERVMLPIATILAVDHAQLRAAMMGSQMGGFVLARYILRLQPLVDADRATLVGMLGPVLQHYLTAPLDLPTSPAVSEDASERA